MPNTLNQWTLDGFVEHFDFVHHKMLDNKFVWILGAGASYASGIPLGSQLVDQWLKELHLREDPEGIPLNEWATDVRLGIKNFDFQKRASFYPRVYERRFKEYPDEGYAYLESVMSRKDPSPGYSILASALALDPPRHNVVITTNFDNLVADALSIYTDTFPFVAGHESLTSFVRVSMRRPLICKIHRDLLLGPQNDPRSLKRLHDAWGTALRALFQHYTPLFIGYGGNDDTLMDLLESLQPGDIKGEMIWCYHEDNEPTERITEVVTELEGVLIPAPDFDLLMVLLGERMEISLLDEEIERRASERTRRYRDRIQELDTIKHPSVTQALAATFDRSGGWWAWKQKARAEKNLERTEMVYKQGIQHCPDSGYLCVSFADFLSYSRGAYTAAEETYRKAMELEPKNAIVLHNFAYFLSSIRHQHDEAELLFRKALDLDQGHATMKANLGAFLYHVRDYREEAESLFKQALELDPSEPYTHCKYANFLLAEGRLKEAYVELAAAEALIENQETRLQATLLFYSAILSRLNGTDDTVAIKRLEALFAQEFERVPPFTDGVLRYIKETLTVEDHELYSGLATGFFDVSHPVNVDLLLQQRETARVAQRLGKGDTELEAHLNSEENN